MTSDAPAGPALSPTTKRIRLRYPGTCRACGTPLPAGETACYDRPSKTVTCLPCASPVVGGPVDIASDDARRLPAESVPDDAAAHPPGARDGDASPSPEAPAAVVGTAGASARREYERRRARRQERVRAAHPRIAGVILALTDDPQSTTAWATGARGEELLGRRLDGLVDSGVCVLHDRRIPGTKANIDHIAVCPGGVFVVDAKRYRGRPRLQVEGGLFRPRIERLLVGSRDQTRLVGGVHRQVALVRDALAGSGLDVPVRGVLCFVEADWPLVGGSFSVDGVSVVWPKKLADMLVADGALDALAIDAVHRTLAAAFPPA